MASIKFDSNRAWQQASAAIRGNREVIFALAGVFFLLPSLAYSLLVPQAPAPAGLQGEAAAKAMMASWSAALPWMVPIAILQAAGTLALLTLLTDRERPTVGQAIRAGFVSLLPYIAAQLILGMGAGLGATLLLGIAGATGSQVVAAIALGAVMVAFLILAVRSSLSAPVVAVEGVYNPVAALTRSWRLTRGNTLRVMGFYALIILAFVVVLTVIMAVSGLVLALFLPPKLQTILGAVISNTVGSGMALTFVAALDATHSQLAGEPAERIGRAFE